MDRTGDVVEVGFAETKIGEVSHFFPKISVAVIEPTCTLKVGDTVRITGKGGKIDFTQKVESMQIDHQKIEQAKPGDLIGLKVAREVCPGCKVFKI